ncbi:MAG: hypothetical protein FWF29_00330, partial [Treponema sp.]|nr:hypothetical protein [Treponema sp.]
MAEITDLYPILKAYSIKIKSPYIQINTFIEYLKKYAIRKVQEKEEWGKWLENTSARFWGELSVLVESDICVLIEDNSGGRVFMPSYFITMLKELYDESDKIAETPFPGEESLGMAIPENQYKTLYLIKDMTAFLELPDDTADNSNTKPVQVIKLIFPEGSGSALLPETMIPRRLLEITMLKVRNYLSSHDNKEFLLHKLIPQFPGKEKYLREVLDQAIVRPVECLNSLKSSGDFTYVFWNHFCGMVKSDIQKRNDPMNEDRVIMQAVQIIEICNGYYRAQAVKLREKEIAFRNLELCMGKPPGYYTKDEIIKFVSDKGILLLEIYSAQDLEDYIKKATTEGRNNLLPEWLMLNSKNDTQQWYIRKDKYLSACARQLVITRPHIRKEISKRWIKMLREYTTVPEMEKDAEFEKLLNTLTASANPVLTSMLGDQKLLWTFEETEHSKNPVPASLQIFKMGKLLPMSELYAIQRKDLLTDAKYHLPFWYSFPIISAIAGFFHRLTGKKRKKTASESMLIEETPESKVKTIKELHSIAETIQSALIPPGRSLEMYMDELENKWNKIIEAGS